MSSATALIVRCFLLCLFLFTICQGYVLNDFSTQDLTAYRPAKKSHQLLALAGEQNLKNCFFSPINCQLIRSPSSYRKLTRFNY